MKSTILVTGGAGYIGSHTAYLLAQQGYQIVILDTLLHDQPFDHGWATLIREDFGNAAVLDKLFANYHVEAVMHFAALIEVGESVKEPLRFYENNVANTITLLERMRAHHVSKIIFSSSCAVYGIPEIIPIVEDMPKNPISPYGTTKLMVEQILKDCAAAYDLQYVCLRYFNAAGAWPEQNLGEMHKPESHIIPRLLQAAHTQQPFHIFGTTYPTKDGTCVRDYLHVRDIAQAHVQALKHLNNDMPSDQFNLGTGHGYSIKQLIEMVEQTTRLEVRTIVADQRPGDPPILIADPTKAQTILLWKPQFSDLEFIIRSANAFYQSKPF